MTINVEWVEELPPAKSRGRQSRYEEFAAVLRENPQRWAKWPKVYSSPSSAHAMRSNIATGNKGAPPPMRTGKWEAEVREGLLYLRYLGE